MSKVTVGLSVSLTDQIRIGANYVNIDIIHNPKHNSDNENNVTTVYLPVGAFNVIPGRTDGLTTPYLARRTY